MLGQDETLLVPRVWTGMGVGSGMSIGVARRYWVHDWISRARYFGSQLEMRESLGLDAD